MFAVNGIVSPKITDLSKNGSKSLSIEDAVNLTGCLILEKRNPFFYADFDRTIIKDTTGVAVAIQGTIDNLLSNPLAVYITGVELLANWAVQRYTTNEKVEMIAIRNLIYGARGFNVKNIKKRILGIKLNEGFMRLVGYLKQELELDKIYMGIRSRTDPYLIYEILNSKHIKETLDGAGIVFTTIRGNVWSKEIVHGKLVYNGKSDVYFGSKKNGNDFLSDTNSDGYHIPLLKNVFIGDGEDYKKNEGNGTHIIRCYNSYWENDVKELKDNGILTRSMLGYSYPWLHKSHFR